MFRCVRFSNGGKSECPSSSIPGLFEHNQNNVAHGNSGWKRHTMPLTSGSTPSCEVSGKQPRDAQINVCHNIEKRIRPWRHYRWFITECSLAITKEWQSQFLLIKKLSEHFQVFPQKYITRQCSVSREATAVSSLCPWAPMWLWLLRRHLGVCASARRGRVCVWGGRGARAGEGGPLFCPCTFPFYFGVRKEEIYEHSSVLL